MHLPTPGGEGFPDLYRRVADFLDELRQQNYRRVALFAHGGVLISAGLYAGLFTAEHAWDNLAPFGGIQTIEL
jgi:alpha-ribazole phosphatase